MDRINAPALHSKPATSSNDPLQQVRPTANKKTTASNPGIEGTDSLRDRNPDSSSATGTGTGTQYETNTKGTAAPGSHSELFGLSPDDGTVHPPDSTSTSTSRAAGSGGVGMSGREGTRGNTAVGTGPGTGVLGGRDEAPSGNTKPSLVDKLNPMTDADRDGKRGIRD